MISSPSTPDLPPASDAQAPRFFCLDLEGVLFPEIWLAVGQRWPDPAFRQTTRERPDYRALCAERFAALDRLGLRWEHLEGLIRSLEPLPGARNFLDSLRAAHPTAIVTDSFDRFVRCLSPKLGEPLVLCHTLRVDEAGRLVTWTERTLDSKASAAASFHRLGYRVTAVGDGLNDLPMLAAAGDPVLFRPSPECLEAAEKRGIPFRIAREYRDILG